MTNPFETLAERFPSLAWPGGYPIAYYDGEGNTLCPKCAQETERRYREDMLGEVCAWALGEELSTSWLVFDRERPQHGDAHYEGPPLVCEECNASIESAYGNPD